MITTDPPPAARRWPSPARISSAAWPALRAKVAVNSSSRALPRLPPPTVPPALATRRSRPPKAFAISSTARVSAGVSVTSAAAVATRVAGVPCSARCRAAAARPSGSRATSPTDAPSAARASAMARPMPRLPPVISARLSRRPRSIRSVRRGKLAAPGGLGQTAGFLQAHAAGLRREPVDRRAAHQGVHPDPYDRRARARRALAADLLVPAHQREAADLDIDRVRDVDVRAAHNREQVDGELAALDLRVAQVYLVTAHDRDGVDAAHGAEPAAPVRAAHDRDHPPDRLAARGRGLRRAGLAGLPRQVAGQGGQLAAGLGVQRLAGPVLELVQGQPADRGVIA